MNSQSPTTVGMPPPVMAKAHLTFSLGMSALLRPGARWKRLEARSTPTLGQSAAVSRIGGGAAVHLTSTPILAGAGGGPRVGAGAGWASGPSAGAAVRVR